MVHTNISFLEAGSVILPCYAMTKMRLTICTHSNGIANTDGVESQTNKTFFFASIFDVFG
jgi:hypothetical protein